MVECIDKTELAQKITEVLVNTQFIAWIELGDTDLTAGEVKMRDERARDYFFSYFGDGKPSVEQMLACNKFNQVVDMQTAMIMRILDV